MTETFRASRTAALALLAPSTGTSSSDSAPAGGQGMAPSRWSEPVTGYPPGYVAPAQLAPTQLSPKIPRPGSSQ